MYLKEIETYGFKSFADKINFEFTNNLNGIVGPNGSGKSNVVDAVRWVLGEQSNKSLRATDNVSVIFSGSKSRKPLNSAMVNLVFDNSDRKLPIDFNYVSIKRVIYRTGESQYYLNGEKCRLKDITELLIDSGAAKESFNIIGQGMIDDIINTKAVDRRIIFEEAAGVLKYKKRKLEAIRKLDRTNININRVNDIINELEGNLEPLKKDSDIAHEYIDVKDRLQNKDISLMVNDVINYSNEFEELKTSINKLSDNISELNSNSSQYDVSMLEYKNRINDIDNNLIDFNNKRLELTKNIEKSHADLLLFRERKKQVNIDESSSKIESLRENILINKNTIQSVINDRDVKVKIVSMLEQEISKENESIDLYRTKINKKTQEINNNNRDITSLKYEINNLQENISNGGNIPQSVKNLIHNPLFSGVYGTVGSLINVCDKYSLAVSTSLGSASNYLVVDDNKSAERMIEYLRNNKLGRATFYPLNVIRPRYIDDDILKDLSNMKGFISTLDKVINYDSKYSSIIMNLFGNVLLVDNINNANIISKAIQNKYKIVTIDGNIVNVGGSITGGDKIKSNNLIQLKYELNTRINKLDTLKKQNEGLIDENNKLEELLKKSTDILHNKNLEKIREEDVISSKNSNLEVLNNKLNDLNRELSQLEAISDNNPNNEEERLLTSYYNLKDELDKLNKNIEVTNLSKDKLQKELDEIDEISKNSSYSINKLEKELKEMELRSGKLEVYIDNILNSLNEDYNITYNEAKNKYILEDDPEEVRREVNRLKSRIKEFGIVNLGAISEYERVSERYNFLVKQKSDLNKAEDTLLSIISDMDSIMKEKFVTTFNQIRHEFKIVFKELFKGGNADVYMTDPDNILETGIELEATPPGKNLKNLESLSGGEKTFTAISLLFAILNVRPVPFCIFDEVEAALDDANVDAFGEYLNKYKDKTQFIIITHKKKTMEFIDTLYGITMQESGVSKKVSVKLNDIK